MINKQDCFDCDNLFKDSKNNWNCKANIRICYYDFGYTTPPDDKIDNKCIGFKYEEE